LPGETTLVCRPRSARPAASDLQGRIDIVFNNAGVAVGGPVAEMTHADWQWIIDVDLWGPIHGVEAFLPHIRAAGPGGHILPHEESRPFIERRFGRILRDFDLA